MLVRKLAYLVIVISLTALTVFTAGCSPEEKVEDEQDKNDLNEHEVEVQADPKDAGEIKGEGTYEEGEEVTVEVDPEEGYEFLGWKIDDDKVSEDKNYHFEITNDKQLKAVFEKKHSIETEGVELDTVTKLPGGLAPQKPFIEASLEENILLSRLAVGKAPYILFDWQEYKESDKQEFNVKEQALTSETIGNHVSSYDSTPEVSNGKVANSYGLIDDERSVIDIGYLKVPFEAEYQIELEDQEFAIGTKPAWDKDHEGIYYNYRIFMKIN